MKNNGWLNTLFALVFLAIPGLIILFWVFQMNNINGNAGYQVGIGFMFLAYAFLFSIGIVFLHMLHIDSISFNIPISFVFTVLMFAYMLPLWASAILVFIAILSTIPTKIYLNKFKNRKRGS